MMRVYYLDETADGLAVCGHDVLLIGVHNTVALRAAQLVLKRVLQTLIKQMQSASCTFCPIDLPATQLVLQLRINHAYTRSAWCGYHPMALRAAQLALQYITSIMRLL